RRSFLPDLFLGRARAHLRAGEVAAARTDLETGIGHLEAERRALAASDRLGIFDTVTELFDEAISLEFAAGDAAEAFNLAERSKARALLEMWGGSPNTVPVKSLDPDTTILEFAFVRRHLLTFIVGGGGVRVVARNTTPAELEPIIETFRRAMMH